MARWGWFVSKVALMIGLAWMAVGCERTPAQAPLAQASAAASVPSQGLTGEWDGMVSRLHLQLIFAAKGGGWTGRLIVVDQENATVPVETVKISGGTLKLDLAAIGATYVGTLNAAGDSFRGGWSQGAMTLPLILHRPGVVPQTAALTLKPPGLSRPLGRWMRVALIR